MSIDSKSGSGRPKNKNFVSYEKAKQYVQESQISSSTEWRRLATDGKIPEQYPQQPDKTYKELGWVNWKSFLGKKGLSKDRISQEKIAGKILHLSYDEKSYRDKFRKEFILKKDNPWKEYLHNKKDNSDNLFCFIKLFMLVAIEENRLSSEFSAIEKTIFSHTSLSRWKIREINKDKLDNSLYIFLSHLLLDLEKNNFFSNESILFSHKELFSKISAMEELDFSSKGKVSLDIKIDNKTVYLEKELVDLIAIGRALNLTQVDSAESNSDDSFIDKHESIVANARKKIEILRKDIISRMKEVMSEITLSLTSKDNQIYGTPAKYIFSQIREIIRASRAEIASKMPDGNISQSIVLHLEREGSFPGDPKEHPLMMYNLLTGIFSTFGDRPIGTFISIIDHNYLFKKYFIEPAWVYASELLSDAKSGLEKQLDNFRKDIENIVQSTDSDFLLSDDQDINDKENQSSQWSKIVILYWLIQNQVIHKNMNLKRSVQGFDDDRIIKRDASFYDEKFSRETGSHRLNSFFEISPYAIELKTEYDDAGEKKNFTEYSVTNLDNYFQREVSPMLEIETKDGSISNQAFRLSNELFKGIDKGSKLSLISISDDSMEPKLSIEDKIIFEEISKDNRNWIKEIEFGKMYVVRTGDDYNVRNLVKPGSLKSGFVNIQTLNSDWPSAEEVDISDISSLEIIGPVRGIIKTD